MKLLETLIRKSDAHHPTVVGVLRKVLAGECMHQCRRCCKYMKSERKNHNCLPTMKLCQLAQTWPRLNKKLVCLFGCQCSFANYKQLAKHYLKEHNWIDLKKLGIHPAVLRQLVKEKQAVAQAAAESRKRKRETQSKRQRRQSKSKRSQAAPGKALGAPSVSTSDKEKAPDPGF